VRAAATQAKRFTRTELSRIGSSFSASPRPRARPLAIVEPPVLTLSAGGNARRARCVSRCNFHYKRKRHAREMDRPATRIYCGVAAFEREHALGHGKRKSPGVPGVLDKQRERWPYKAIRLTVLIARTRRASFDARHIELLHCASDVDREREKEMRSYEARPASTEMEKTKKIKGLSRDYSESTLVRARLLSFSSPPPPPPPFNLLARNVRWYTE